MFGTSLNVNPQATRLAVLVLLTGAMSACGRITTQPDPAVTGVTWQLVQIDGRPAGQGANGSPATLLLHGNGQAGGYAGCNGFGGSYSMTGDDLNFSGLGMTRMACPGYMDLETRYAAALEAVSHWRIRNGHLELLAGDRVRARYRQ